MNKAYWIEYFQNVSNDFYNRNIVDVLQEVEKDITDYLETVAQQPLSGSANASPKCQSICEKCGDVITEYNGSICIPCSLKD